MKQFSEYPPSRRALLVLSSGLLIGYIPVASGTFATLLAIALLYPLQSLNVARFPSGLIFAALVVGAIAAAIALSHLAERTYGEKDSHKIVVDEIVGLFVAMTFVPFHWPQVVAAFFLFRLFDVVKPPPIRRLQSLPGGWGVVADDILAGLYACLIVHALMALKILG